MELYIKPEFYNNIFDPSLLRMDTTDISKEQDLYTRIKCLTSDNITSKFKEIRYIPLSGGDLDYEDERWDFSAYSIVKNPHSTLNFGDCTPIFRNDLKDFIILLILNGNIKISSIYSEFIQTKALLNYLADTGLFTISGLDDSDIEKFFENLVMSERTFIKYQGSVKKFLQLYDAEHNTELYTPGIDEMCKRMEFKKLKSIIIANRRKAIPEEYFNMLLSHLIKVMNDKNRSLYERGLAAMLVIDSQTGLRASELSLLEADSIEEIDIDGTPARMIHYKIIKTAKGNTGYLEEITYINDISYEAYKVAYDVFAENRKQRNSNLLCCPRNASLPLQPDTYIKFLKKECVIKHEMLSSTNESLKNDLDGSITKSTFIKHFFKGKSNRVRVLDEFHDNQEFYYPLVHQFRNTVVTSLLEKGIQLEFVRRFMGHLTEEMTSAYAESYDTKMQENLTVSESALNTIVSGEAKLLGPNAQRLTDGIDDWIRKNKLNVASDLDEIINGLEKLIPIRAKHGGICIKGSKITNACSVDVPTDEFLCAVGLCPNICHFYFNANVSYNDYKKALSTYEFNKQNGFTRQADKELSKANHILMNRLAPEIVELDKEMQKSSMNSLLEKHPELQDVLAHIDEIREAIDEYVEEKFR